MGETVNDCRLCGSAVQVCFPHRGEVYEVDDLMDEDEADLVWDMLTGGAVAPC
jgi:hypothetical protein